MAKLFKKSGGGVAINTNIADELVQGFSEGTDEYIKAVDAIIADAAAELLVSLREKSPVGKTKKYRDSWVDEKRPAHYVKLDGSAVPVTNHYIGNTTTVGKKDVPLSNILEFGRVGKAGKIVGKRPHILKAAEEAEKSIFEKIGG